MGHGPDSADSPRRANVINIQGLQIGHGNTQYNLFLVTPPPGPVVAGRVPLPPPGFQPREDLLAKLRDAGAGVSVVRAVTGLRGVGKTQLAAAYARECSREGWRLIAWVNAETSAAVLDGLAEVAGRLGIDTTGKTLEAIGGEVRNRLEADGGRCLIVFDNVTTFETIRPYVPALGEPQAVITTTARSLPVPRTALTVDVFTPGEALAFLAARTDHDDPDGASTLAFELGYLPLALAQAASVIIARRLTYPAYLDLLRAYPAQRHLPLAEDDPYYPQRGVAETILLSIDAVVASDPTGLCSTLLSIVSLLSPDGVSRNLLYLAETTDTRPDDAAAQSNERADDDAKEVIDKALSRLANASLLTFNGDYNSDPVLTAHRLVMRVIRERCGQEGTLTTVAVKTCRLLTAAAKSLGESWKDQGAARDLVRQVMALNGHLTPRPESGNKPLNEAVLARRGWALGCLIELGDSAAQAIELGESLVNDRARLLGDDHPHTLSAQNNLALAYRAEGRLGEAVPLFERTLAGWIRVVGDDHPDTVMSRHNLAFAYDAAGRTEEAIPLFEQALADRVRLLGDDHPDTLITRDSLGAAYRAAGRLEDGVRLLERSLADSARVLGDDHPDTLKARNNLAMAYRAAGRVEEALPLFERSAADRVRVLGEDHPDTLRAWNNLAFAYRAAGRLEEAVRLHERTLADSLRVLGDGHPDTVASQNNLALAYRAAGQLGAAVPLFEQALVGSQRVLGGEHPTTVTVRKNLEATRREAKEGGSAIGG